MDVVDPGLGIRFTGGHGADWQLGAAKDAKGREGKTV